MYEWTPTLTGENGAPALQSHQVPRQCALDDLPAQRLNPQDDLSGRRLKRPSAAAPHVIAALKTFAESKQNTIPAIVIATDGADYLAKSFVENRVRSLL